MKNSLKKTPKKPEPNAAELKNIAQTIRNEAPSSGEVIMSGLAATQSLIADLRPGQAYLEATNTYRLFNRKHVLKKKAGEIERIADSLQNSNSSKNSKQEETCCDKLTRMCLIL